MKPLHRNVAAALAAGALLVGALAHPVTAGAIPGDSDGDALTDEQEAALGTNPQNPDSDEDGLSDLLEVDQFRTDPNRFDTDDDGMGDQQEINQGRDPLVSEAPDSDGDGLSDSDERRIFFTNPFFTDTDLDGVPDGEEVRNGTGPLNVFDN